MRIIDGYQQQNALPLTGPKQGAATKGSASGQAVAAARPAARDTVTFYSEVKELGDHASAADAEKVEQLRSSMEDGTFKIDPRAIANKIVEGDEGSQIAAQDGQIAQASPAATKPGTFAPRNMRW